MDRQEPREIIKGTKKTVRLRDKAQFQGRTWGRRPDLGPSQTQYTPQEMRSVSGLTRPCWSPFRS